MFDNDDHDAHFQGVAECSNIYTKEFQCVLKQEKAKDETPVKFST